MTANLHTTRFICLLSDLADPGTRAFTLGAGDWPLKGFVVRKGERVHAYLNRCPHAGHPLNWHPDEFMTSDHALLLCTSHGARFEIATGICVAGPCTGDRLRALPVKVEHDYVLLVDDPDELAAQLA